MSSDNKGKFLNIAIPIGSLSALNILALCLVAFSPHPGPGLFLAWITLIAVTMGYFFVAKPFASESVDNSQTARPAPAVDLTKTLEVAARLDQIVGDIEYLKRSGPDVKALKQQMAALQQQTVSPDSLRADIARLRDQMGGIQKLSSEVSRLKDLVERQSKTESGGRADAAEVERLADAVSQIEEQLRQDEGGTEAELTKLASEVEDLRQSEQAHEQGVRQIADAVTRLESALKQSQTDLNRKATKEEIAAVQQEVGAAVAVRDEIARFNGQLAELQDLSSEVARLKEAVQDDSEAKSIRKTLQSEKKRLTESMDGLRAQVNAVQDEIGNIPNAATVLSLRTDIDRKLEDFRSDLDQTVNPSQLREVSDHVMAKIEALQQAVKALQNSKVAEEVEQLKKQLDKTVQVPDVEKLADSVKHKFAEIGESIASLGEDLNRTKEQMEGMERLEDAEKAIAGIQAQVEEMRADVREASRKDDVMEQVSRLGKRVDSLREDLSRVAAGMQQKTDDIEETLDKSLVAVKGQIAEAQKDVRHDAGLAEKVAAIDDDVASLRQALTSMQQIRKDLAETKSQFSSLKSDLAPLQDVPSQIKELKAEVKEQMSAIESLPDRMEPKEEFEQALSDLHRRIGEVETLAKQAADTKKIEGLSSKLAGVSERLAELDNVRDKLSEFSGIADDVEKMREQISALDGLSDIEEQVAGISKMEDAIDRLRNELADSSDRTQTADAINDLQRQINRLQLSLEKTAGAKDVEEVSARQEKATAELRQRLDELAAIRSEPLQEMKEALDAQSHRMETVARENERAARDLGRKIDEQMEQVAAASLTQEQADAVKQELTESIRKLSSRLDEAMVAATETMDVRFAEMGRSVDALKAEVNAIGEKQSDEGLVKHLEEQISDLRAGFDGLRSQLDEQIAHVTAELSGEMARLRKETEAMEEAPSQSDVIAQEILFLREGLSVLEQVAEHVAAPEAAEAKVAVATATEDAQLVMNMNESKLIRTKDGTTVECRLTITNPSDNPIEIIAVRAELDSGKERMTPTVNKYWLPVGVEPERDRSLALPFRVLDSTTSQEIQYTVTGWPLEKSKESYDFRIVLLDENKGKHTATFPLAPPE
ncbi:MAG: hypothetical protein GXP25_14940 [Planctomycetes bacterium]|nr:hypothetical protein [Planctomycetota bacterium]